MTTLLISLILTFIVGLLIKYADQLEDAKKNRDKRGYAIVIALVWGALLGYLISTAPFSMILAAGIFAMVIMRKIDATSHVVGILMAVLFAVLFGLPPFDVVVFTTLVFFAAIDEWDDFIFFEKPKWVQDFRPFLEIGAIVIGLYNGNWLYLAGILAFDIGYVSMALMTTKGVEEGPVTLTHESKVPSKTQSTRLKVSKSTKIVKRRNKRKGESKKVRTKRTSRTKRKIKRRSSRK